MNSRIVYYYYNFVLNFKAQRTAAWGKGGGRPLPILNSLLLRYECRLHFLLKNDFNVEHEFKPFKFEL